MIICQKTEIFDNFKSLVIYKISDIMVIRTKNELRNLWKICQLQIEEQKRAEPSLTMPFTF